MQDLKTCRYGVAGRTPVAAALCLVGYVVTPNRRFLKNFSSGKSRFSLVSAFLVMTPWYPGIDLLTLCQSGNGSPE